MEHTCPSCLHPLRFDRPAPGAYTLQCPRCSALLKLTVPEDADQPPTLAVRGEVAEVDSSEPAELEAMDAGDETAFVPTSGPLDASSEGAGWEETLFQAQPRGPSNAPRQPRAAEAGAEFNDVAPRGTPPPSGSLDVTIAETGDETPGPADSTRSSPPPSGADAAALEATEAQTPVAAGESVEPAEVIPDTLGGYRVLGRLGRGGMGSVYRARQLSLDRDVALKVMAPQLASDPTFVARFCREAYAAAQLVHHNIVQIYDFGEQYGTHYFSMEFVDGTTLADLLKQKGRLEPEEAAGYILQAARGLKLAHDRGLVHRDIKPENLMLNRFGMVKVADLGLVKSVAEQPDLPPAGQDPAGALEDEAGQAGVRAQVADSGSLAAQVTRADVAMGTPAYMAPEQARDATHVDQRADIYSLGCTLYALITGGPPFKGKSALELITKHASEPIVPPALVIKGTPDKLSAIILKMVAKKAEDRFADLDQVIAALEAFLSVRRAEPLTDLPEDAGLLEQGLRALGGSTKARLRSMAPMALAGACAVGVVLALLMGQLRWAGAVIGIGLLTPLAYALIGAVTGRSPLWLRARQYAIESDSGERLAAAAGVLLLLAVLWQLGIVWITLAMALGALALAAIARLLIGRQGEQGESVERLQDLLRGLRRRGFDEESICRFVAERAGPRWGAVRDALFGDEERLTAWRSRGRAEWDRARSGLAAWQESALAWFETRVRDRQDARVRKHLEHVEAESLRTQGMTLAAAQRKARRAAEAMIAQAAELRRVGLRASQTLGAALSTEAERQKVIRSFHEAAENPERILRSLEKSLLARRSEESLGALLGPRTRFLAGLVLALGFVLWAAQNGGRPEGEPTAPLRMPLIPSLVTGVFRDWNAGIAGLILMASALYRGWRIGLLVFPAAAIALIGSTLGLPSWLGLLAAIALSALGFALGRSGPVASQSIPT
jgi:serine/threonine protein kinase